MANIFKFMAKKPKKTAMQQHIDLLETYRKKIIENAPEDSYKDVIEAVDICLISAKMSLDLEKQQIIDANNAGFKACRRNIPQNASDYYFETFKLD